MIIKNTKELDALREGGHMLAEILQEVLRAANPGVSTQSLDEMAERLIRVSGGAPSFKGYSIEGAPMPYPASLCVSVNNEVVHGIPSDRILKKDDVVGFDIGMLYQGFYTDTAATVIVKDLIPQPLLLRKEKGGEKNKPSPYEGEGKGEVHCNAKRLVDATREALDFGIREVRAGAYVGDIGFVIQRHLEDRGFGVVRELVGHGVGGAVHEDPEIPNWGRPRTGYQLHEGEVIALEPMATAGSHKVKILSDGWTWATKDDSIAAHFEHTMVVTRDGCEVLTKI